MILGLALYANSAGGEYALDDGIVILNNAYVQAGIAGIPKILTTDAYDSYAHRMGAGQQLSGGRYRPLSIVTFALEQQLFGGSPLVSHAINVGLYLATIWLLLLLLEKLLYPDNPGLAFAATLLFTIHPLHTEVVANIKSRDEILSLIFILATLVFAFLRDRTPSRSYRVATLAAFGLALLAKEYAVTLLVLVPLMLFIFRRRSAVQALAAGLPLVPIAAAYVAVRIVCVGASQVASTDVLNDPYLFASVTERWATKILVLGKYFWLLVVPYPLSCDYSYKQIAYTNFGDPRVWLSLAIHAAMLAGLVVSCRRRRPLGFALALYLAPLLLVSNLIVGIGATMGERLVYHSSVGFCLAAAHAGAYALGLIPAPAKVKLGLAGGVLAAATLVSALIVVPRNAVWKNDITLFTHDVQVVPDSVLANGNAGARYIELADKPENRARSKALLNTAMVHLEKAVRLHPRFVNGYLSLGVAAFKLGDLAAARQAWAMAERLYPGNPFVKEYTGKLAEHYLAAGLVAARDHRLDEAIRTITLAGEIAPSNAEIWAQLGGAYYTAGDFPRAREAWTRALAIDPAREDARGGLRAIGSR